MEDALPSEIHVTIPELKAYFKNAFGNATRIDYGSGHELSFCAWLCGLAMLKVFEKEDFQALVLRVFTRWVLIEQWKRRL
jgi:serine/threonine-protein phosphatase 2A activator